MSKPVISTLKSKVMVAAYTYDVCRRGLSKPSIGIGESLDVVPLEAAKITAVNQDVTFGNGHRSVFPVGIRDYAERKHCVSNL